ncbi:hypothetical protein ACGYLO_11555 [Sulfitobacter sp. 1A13353]|uniref:hypothetical protein n=1 Tax=Sulfitobacter sp. 1A13353 TaxID=3368568 RepID=UPI0037466F5C
MNKINRQTETTSFNISSVELKRQDGGEDMTLGLAGMPGGVGGSGGRQGLKADLAVVSAWRPDMVVVLVGDEMDSTDDISTVVGEAVVHVIDTDAWPIAEDPDLLAERREILCNVLLEMMNVPNAKVLLISDHGNQDVTTLAAELMMIAGMQRSAAKDAIQKIHADAFDLSQQDEFLAGLPEALAGGCLNLPLSGGWVISIETRGEGSESIETYVLRTDGMHAVDLGSSKRMEDFGYKALCNFKERTEAKAMGLCAPHLKGQIKLTGANRMDALKVLAKVTMGAGLTNSLVTDGPLEIGSSVTLSVYGKISEETFRSMPQAGF